MRARTVAAVALVVAVLAGVVVLGVGMPGSGGDLTERWTSDTPRQNERNHHAIGASEDGSVVVAPVAEVPNDGVPLTNTSCTLARLNTSDGAVLWRTTIPPERCFTHALSEPVIEDLDGDGTRDVVSSTIENALVAYDAEDGSEQWRVPLNTREDTYGYGRPTAADLLDAPGREVVASSIHGDVVAVTATGDVAWRANLSEVGIGQSVVEQRPVVADLDADGAPEVAVGSGRGLLVLHADGSVAWNRSVGSQYLVAAQADDDPARELLVGDGTTLVARDGETGAVQWRTEAESSLRYRAVADVDGDGVGELVAGNFDGEAVAIDVRTGDVEWRTPVSSEGQPVWAPTTVDLTGDGDPEVVTTSRDGTVSVLDGGGDGSGGGVLATYERTVPIETHVTTADLDGDGTSELLVRYGDGRVVALDYAS